VLLYTYRVGQKWTVFRVNNFVTFNVRKVCNMLGVSEKGYYLYVSEFEYS